MATIHTTSADFQFNDDTVTLPRNTFAALADALAQFQAYSEEMRAIGRGLHVSGPFGTDVLACIVNTALIEARQHKGADCVLCGLSTFGTSYVSLPSGHVSHCACHSAQ